MFRHLAISLLIMMLFLCGINCYGEVSTKSQPHYVLGLQISPSLNNQTPYELNPILRGGGGLFFGKRFNTIVGGIELSGYRETEETLESFWYARAAIVVGYYPLSVNENLLFGIEGGLQTSIDFTNNEFSSVYSSRKLMSPFSLLMQWKVFDGYLFAGLRATIRTSLEQGTPAYYLIARYVLVL